MQVYRSLTPIHSSLHHMKGLLIALSLLAFFFLVIANGISGQAHRVPWKPEAAEHGLQGTTALKNPNQNVIDLCLRDIAAESLPKMRVWGTFQNQNSWIYVFSKNGIFDAPLLLYFQNKKTGILEKKSWSTFDLN